MPYCSISGATEGIVDEAVLGRLLSDAGGMLDRRFGRQGKRYLIDNLAGYNAAARREPWVVLIDLNGQYSCAPELVADILPISEQYMSFRVAVREVEAWLLADSARMAEFLAVPAHRVPTNPDAIDQPKECVVDLARKSRRRAIREDMVPIPGGGRSVGPAYTSRLIEFIQDPAGWRPSVAAAESESLGRCRNAIDDLIRRACPGV